MGSVYVAEQREPVRRRVALKVIKWGMDTKEVLARFEVEHHALTIMNHPNIARVYDAGATSEGRPYFVMEYVPGIPLTDYCDGERLSTREARARLHEAGADEREDDPVAAQVILEGWLNDGAAAT